MRILRMGEFAGPTLSKTWGGDVVRRDAIRAIQDARGLRSSLGLGRDIR